MATGDAFEDVLYGSESELDDSDDDTVPDRSGGQPKRNTLDHGARLRLDDDEPMDLLQGVASRITSMRCTSLLGYCSSYSTFIDAAANRRRKPGQEAHHFKTDSDTGKMIIDNDDGLENEDVSMTDVGGVAYRENITSVDGFSRGPNGRIKFNKDTKKRRREMDEIDDEVMADGDGSAVKTLKNERKADVKLGHEFKAKVGVLDIFAYSPPDFIQQKAGGDIKKGSLDPYAYVTLSQAAKKGARGKRPHVGITGKR